ERSCLWSSERRGIFPKAGTLRQAAQVGRDIKNTLFLKAISDAIERLDHLEIVVNALEFLAQTLDVSVDCPIVDINLVVIGGIHQRVAALNHSGAGCESLKDEKLGDRERDRLTL